MKVIVCENYEAVSRAGADIMEKIIRENPTCTIGLATGSSPVGMYKELARRCKEEGLDFSKIHSVNLDEYVGLEPTHDQSYRYFMDDNLFNHINIDKANTYVAKGIGDAEENLRAKFNFVEKNAKPEPPQPQTPDIDEIIKKATAPLLERIAGLESAGAKATRRAQVEKAIAAVPESVKK